MPGGRQTEYTQEHNEKAIAYIANLPEGQVIPSIAGLAVYLEVNRSTVYKWRDENKEFSDTLEYLLDNQEVKALNSGLNGDFTPAITKLVLANHGYSDKQEIEQTTNFAVVSDSPLTEEEWENKHGG